MAAYINGQKIARPVINGVDHNAYINGQKIWGPRPSWPGLPVSNIPPIDPSLPVLTDIQGNPIPGSRFRTKKLFDGVDVVKFTQFTDNTYNYMCACCSNNKALYWNGLSMKYGTNPTTISTVGEVLDAIYFNGIYFFFTPSDIIFVREQDVPAPGNLFNSYGKITPSNPPWTRQPGWYGDGLNLFAVFNGLLYAAGNGSVIEIDTNNLGSYSQTQPYTVLPINSPGQILGLFEDSGYLWIFGDILYRFDGSVIVSGLGTPTDLNRNFDNLAYYIRNNTIFGNFTQARGQLYSINMTTWATTFRKNFYSDIGHPLKGMSCNGIIHLPGKYMPDEFALLDINSNTTWRPRSDDKISDCIRYKQKIVYSVKQPNTNGMSDGVIQPIIYVLNNTRPTANTFVIEQYMVITDENGNPVSANNTYLMHTDLQGTLYIAIDDEVRYEIRS